MLSEELLNKKFKLKLVIQTIFLKNKLLENHELITEIDQEEKIIKKEEKEDKIEDNKEKEDLEDKMVIEDHLDNTKIDPKEKVKMIDQKCNGLKLVLLNPDKKDLTF